MFAGAIFLAALTGLFIGGPFAALGMMILVTLVWMIRRHYTGSI